jgi:DNA-binding transcriptional MerR regulator
MRIGQVARVLAVSVDTIRRVEKRGGVTPTRDWAGQRRYSTDDVERLRSALFPSTRGTRNVVNCGRERP